MGLYVSEEDRKEQQHRHTSTKLAPKGAILDAAAEEKVSVSEMRSGNLVSSCTHRIALRWNPSSLLMLVEDNYYLCRRHQDP